MTANAALRSNIYIGWYAVTKIEYMWFCFDFMIFLLKTYFHLLLFFFQKWNVNKLYMINQNNYIIQCLLSWNLSSFVSIITIIMSSHIMEHFENCIIFTKIIFIYRCLSHLPIFLCQFLVQNCLYQKAFNILNNK